MMTINIKPLEWGETSYGAPEVVTIAGTYRLNNAWNGGWSVTRNNVGLQRPDGLTNFATEQEAKAATEADYRQRILSALETQEEEAVDAETRLAQLEEIADGAWGDNPMVRGKARDEAARLRSSAHSTPVQKEEEGQTVSERYATICHNALVSISLAPADEAAALAKDALSRAAALVKP